MADPVSALTIAAIATTAVGTVVSGIQQRKAADAEADLIREQGRLTAQESREEAARIEKENRKFIARQKLAFLKNGVSLTGSPLLILSESTEESEKQVESVKDRGVAQQTLAQRRAKITEDRGRAALTGSVFRAGSTAFSQGVSAKNAGFFG